MYVLWSWNVFKYDLKCFDNVSILSVCAYVMLSSLSLLCLPVFLPACCLFMFFSCVSVLACLSAVSPSKSFLSVLLCAWLCVYLPFPFSVFLFNCLSFSSVCVCLYLLSFLYRPSLCFYVLDSPSLYLLLSLSAFLFYLPVVFVCVSMCLSICCPSFYIFHLCASVCMIICLSSVSIFYLFLFTCQST